MRGPAPGRREAIALLLASGGVAGCSPAGILNALAPERMAADGLAYGPAPRQRLDVYVPPGHLGPAPVLVFFYGGTWNSGTRALYRFVGSAYADAGFVTIIPDYRLYPEVRYPVFLQDCALAVAWVRRHCDRFGGDRNRLSLMGHSAGAYNAAMLALDPDFLGAVGIDRTAALRRVIGLAGPYDFLPLDTAELRAIFEVPAASLPGTQPINHVDGHAAPMLLATGTSDKTVRPRNVSVLGARIRHEGGFVDEVFYPGLDHVELIGAVAPTLRFLAPVWRDTVAFLRS